MRDRQIVVKESRGSLTVSVIINDYISIYDEYIIDKITVGNSYKEFSIALENINAFVFDAYGTLFDVNDQDNNFYVGGGILCYADNGAEDYDTNNGITFDNLILKNNGIYDSNYNVALFVKHYNANITNTVIEDNIGGGIYLHASKSVLDNVVVQNNNFGNLVSSNSYPVFTNCIFANNNLLIFSLEQLQNLVLLKLKLLYICLIRHHLITIL